MKSLHIYMAKYWWRYAIGMFSLFIAVILDNISPLVSKTIVDDVITGGKTDLLTPALVMFGVILIGRTITQYTKEYNMDMAGCSIATDIRKDLFDHVQSLSLDFFDRTNTGEIMSRLTGDIDSLWGGVGYIFMLCFEVILNLTIVIIMMFRISWKLALFPVIVLPFACALAIFLEKKLDKVYGDISEEQAALNTVAEENVSGTRTVKAFSREKYEIAKFFSHNKKYYDLNMSESKLMVRYYPFFELVTKILPIVSVMIGGAIVMNGEISLGDLTAFIMYCGNLSWPMDMIGWLSNEMASAYAAFKKLKKLNSEVPRITEPKDPMILSTVKGNVRFENVSFSVDDKSILKNISFDLPAGKTLGIMGETGSGKTSILSMLFRFYDPSEGRVLFDNTDVRTLSLSQLRSSIAQVSQDVFLFSDTVNENIRFGKKNSTSDYDICDALVKASADFVDELENKRETVIGERGVGLSGGQKQRLSIARALAKHAPVLVLDDSTSALDTETEHEIQKTLETLPEITKIIISHRISAVRHADEIIVLKNGEIHERGTHEELLAKKGLYHETYSAQYGFE